MLVEPEEPDMKGQRPRSVEAVERERELLETFAEAAKRSTWNPSWEDPEDWNPRHQLSYKNDAGLHHL